MDMTRWTSEQPPRRTIPRFRFSKNTALEVASGMMLAGTAKQIGNVFCENVFFDVSYSESPCSTQMMYLVMFGKNVDASSLYGQPIIPITTYPHAGCDERDERDERNQVSMI